MIETTDAVLALDVLQNSDQARVCPLNKDHGKLWVHKSGSVLFCQGDKATCKFQLSVDREMIELGLAIKDAPLKTEEELNA